MDQNEKKVSIFKVLSKNEMEARIAPVLNEAAGVLAQSFGKYGANTFIGSGIHVMATKDGYTIAKYLSSRDNIDKIDSMIFNIMKTPCERVNNTVGDGTTTAFISAQSIYNSYLDIKTLLEGQNFVPKDIIEVFIKIRDKIIEGIQKRTVKIDVNDADALAEEIYKVLYISTNGDEEISTMISEMYRELKYPSIQVEMSNDGHNHKKIIDGYEIQVVTTDGIYVNSENDICYSKDVDALVLDLKINADIYNSILKPINEQCRARGRRLVVIATQYDDTAMEGLIGSELRYEYRDTKEINMILCTASNKGSDDKKRLSDLAMLLNTDVINATIKDMGIDNILDAFNLDHRNIPGIQVYDSSSLIIDDGQADRKKEGTKFRVGFCHECELGKKKSIFRGFHYNTELYKTHVKEAKGDLEIVKAKYEAMGIFNIEIAIKQARLYSLGLKVGIIEIGGDSDLMQSYLKDTVDDGVKAAASAYQYGLIQGCNVTLLQILDEMRLELFDNYGKDSIEVIIHEIFYNGFVSVYKTVLKNMCDDIVIESTGNLTEDKASIISQMDNYLQTHIRKDNTNLTIDIFDKDILDDITTFYKPDSAHMFIIKYSILTGKVFDLNKKEFNNEVINSAQTDIEVLKAVTDLISLLISGKQLVIM